MRARIEQDEGGWPGEDDPVEGDAPPALLVAGAALFTPTVLFFSAPSNIIFHNLHELGYPPRLMAAFLGALAGLFLLTWPVFRLAARSRAARWVARLVVVAGLSVLTFDGAAAGGYAFVHDPLAIGVIDMVAFTIAVALVMVPPFGVVTRIVGLAAPVLLVVTSVPHVEQGWAAWQTARRRGGPGLSSARAARAAPAAPRAGNVYHVLLDAFQREAYAVLVDRDPDLRLADFHYYRRFSSTFGYTYYSVPQMLASRDYAPDTSIAAWRRGAFRDGLWARLAAQGVDVHLYPYHEGYCRQTAGLTASCVAPDLPEPEWLPDDGAGDGEDRVHLAGTSSQRVTVDLWFLSLLPRSVRHLLTAPVPGLEDSGELPPDLALLSFSITDAVAPRRASPGGRPVKWIPFDHRAAYSVQQWRRLLEDEAARPAHGQYVFIHAAIPHHPYVLDSECAYQGVVRSDVTQYLAQATCGLRMVHALVDRLKALGRYDDALIVVHSDHGMQPYMQTRFRAEYADFIAPELLASPGNLPGNLRPSKTGPFAPRTAALRSAALLLVKYPHEQGGGSSERYTDMVDVTPTILHHFDIAPTGLDGVPLQEPPDGRARDRVFLAGFPKARSPVPRGNVFWKYHQTTAGAWALDGTMPVTP